MTEAEWLVCANPKPMLELLRRTWKHSLFEFGKWIGVLRQNRTERKFRLFACACMRHVWERLDEPTRKATEVAERYADGEAKRGEMDAAGKRHQIPAVAEPTLMLAGDAALHAADEAARLLATNNLDDPRRQIVFQRLSTLLRCIIGNPFRSVTFDQSWRTSTVLALAREMYESSDFSPMPILADALQDAGCDEAVILNHCRGEGPHVRGCWVVDALLGKE